MGNSWYIDWMSDVTKQYFLLGFIFKLFNKNKLCGVSISKLGIQIVRDFKIESNRIETRRLIVLA